MIKIQSVAFTSYPVTDLTRARAFYEGVLGLRPSATYYMSPDNDQGLVEYEVGGGTFSIGSGAPMSKPGGNNAAAALEVEDFPAAMARIAARGLKRIDCAASLFLSPCTAIALPASIAR